MNNKIKPLLLSVATLLGVTGCGPVEPTTLNLEKTLNEFKAGIKLSSTIHEVHDNEESITYAQFVCHLYRAHLL